MVPCHKLTGARIMPRKSNTIRKEVKEVLFCCEGETEENYLRYVVQGYISRNDIKFIIRDYDTTDKLNGFFKHNKSHLNPTAVIRFCDLDRVSNDTTECRNLKEFEDYKNTKITQYKTVYTYPCLEFWYLLHFEFSASTGYIDCASVTTRLETHIPNYKKPMPTNRGEAKAFLENIEHARENETQLENNTSDSKLACASQVRTGDSLRNPMSEVGKLITFLETL